MTDRNRLREVYILLDTHSCVGMAVRSAYALGLHRDETLAIFSESEQTTRRNVWKSLFVMDRFISCQLGRPTAINEDECSGDTLTPNYPACEGDMSGMNPACPLTSDFETTSKLALDAAVRSCSVVGTVLKRIYQQRKISTRVAQDIADICKMWSKSLAPMLHWTQASRATESQGVAILHVNLFYCHSIVLLTRPFFLYVLNKEAQRQAQPQLADHRSPRPHGRMEKFSEACVVASTHTVVLAQNTFETGCLPRRNPAVIYFVFAAALVILSNEFAGLYINTSADNHIDNAVNIMAYCAETDNQARRLLDILSSYRDVVLQQRERRLLKHQMRLHGAPHHRKYPSESLPLTQHYSAGSDGVALSQQNVYRGTQSASPDASKRPSQQRNQQSPNRPPFQSSTSSPFPAPGLHTSHNDSPSSHTLGFQPYNTSSRSEQAVSGAIPATPTTSGTSTHSPYGSQAILPGFSGDIQQQHSLPSLLDPETLGGLNPPSLAHEDTMGTDDQIDFDALWSWPMATPLAETPRFGENGGIEGTVPLFGVIDGV
jgi:hypothetical protein